MTFEDLAVYIKNEYGVSPDYPWASYPDYAVFRRKDNQKWFALFMIVKKKVLNMKDEGEIRILNLKCEPFMIGSLRMEKGFFPAYHMDKTHWISLSLEGEIDEETIKSLIDNSYQLSKNNSKKNYKKRFDHHKTDEVF